MESNNPKVIENAEGKDFIVCRGRLLTRTGEDRGAERAFAFGKSPVFSSLSISGVSDILASNPVCRCKDDSFGCRVR